MTGASGGLSSALSPALMKQKHQIIATDIVTSEDPLPNFEMMDVRDWNQVKSCIDQHRPDWVMHLAAETDVDKCEVEPEHSYKTNTIGTENIAMACAHFSVPLVYISTGGVFNGNKREPYTEYDLPDPVSVYARSKLEGEKIVQSLLKKYFIFRAGWMVGGGKKDKKFVAKIVRLLQTQKEIKAVSDKFGTPTFVWDMANLIIQVIQTERYGIYHAVNHGMTTRYEIAKKIVELLGKKDVQVHPVSSSVFPLPAPRAVSEAMVNYKLNLLGLNTMPPWEESLALYLKSQKEF